MTTEIIAPEVGAEDIIPVAAEEPKPKKKRRTKAEMEAFRAEQAAKKAEKDKVTIEVTDPLAAATLPVGTPVIVRRGHSSRSVDKFYTTHIEAKVVRVGVQEGTDYGTLVPGVETKFLGIQVETENYRTYENLYQVDVMLDPESEWVKQQEERYMTLLRREHDLWKYLHQEAVDNSWCPQYEAWAKTVEGGEKWLKAGEKWNAKVTIEIPFNDALWQIRDYLPRGIVLASERIRVSGTLRPNSESRQVPDIEEKQVDQVGIETVENALKRLKDNHGETAVIEVNEFKPTKAIKMFDQGNVLERITAAERRWESVWLSLIAKATDGDGYGSLVGVRRLYKNLVEANHHMGTFVICEFTMHQLVTDPEGGIKGADGKPFHTFFLNHGLPLAQDMKPTLAQRFSMKFEWTRRSEPNERDVLRMIQARGQVPNITRVEVHKSTLFGLEPVTAPPKGFMFGRTFKAWREVKKAGTKVLIIDSDSSAWEPYIGAIGTWRGDGYGGSLQVEHPETKRKHDMTAFGRDYTWRELLVDNRIPGPVGKGEFKVGTWIETSQTDGAGHLDTPRRGEIIGEYSGDRRYKAVKFDPPIEYNGATGSGNTGHEHAWWVKNVWMSELVEPPATPPKVEGDPGTWVLDPNAEAVIWQDLPSGRDDVVRVRATVYPWREDMQNRNFIWKGNSGWGGHFRLMKDDGEIDENDTHEYGAGADDRFHLLVQVPEAEVATYNSTNRPPEGTFIRVTSYDGTAGYVGQTGWYGTAAGYGKNPADRPELWIKNLNGSNAVWLSAGQWSGVVVPETPEMVAMVHDHVNNTVVATPVPVVEPRVWTRQNGHAATPQGLTPDIRVTLTRHETMPEAEGSVGYVGDHGSFVADDGNTWGQWVEATEIL